MESCNLSMMERFDCEALREKRARAISVIADDQRLRDSLAAQIRNIEMQIAHKRADMEQLRSRLPEPTLPGFVALTGQDDLDDPVFQTWLLISHKQRCSRCRIGGLSTA